MKPPIIPAVSESIDMVALPARAHDFDDYDAPLWEHARRYAHTSRQTP